ncbi:MAG TPA: response regulator [Polyangiaceae bacterium]|nr:response regulator [Polyangiaceae bacterium]
MKRALVLCVEDEEQFALLLNRWLKDEEIDVILASSAGDAEDQLRSRSSQFDAVVLDLGLDDSRGIDTFQRIALAMGGNLVPIIVLTGAVDTETQRRLFHAGARDVLLKDWGETRIVRAIQHVIRSSRSGPQRKDSPVGNPMIASQDWVKLQLSELREELHDVVDWVRSKKRDDEQRSIRPSKRTPLDVLRSDWPGAIKEIARAAVIIAGTYGAVRATTPQQPSAPVAQQEQHAEPSPRWTRRSRDQDPQQGQRGTAPVTTSATTSATP